MQMLAIRYLYPHYAGLRRVQKVIAARRESSVTAIWRGRKLQLTIAVSLVPIIGFFSGYEYYMYKIFERQSKIQKICEKGSCPEISSKVEENRMDRPEVINKILQNFILPKTFDMFGLIIGPTGTGKTTAVKMACNSKPLGVLYFELKDNGKIDLPKMAAKCINMDLELTWVGNLFEKITNTKVCYCLPSGPNEGMKYIFHHLKEVKKKMNHSVPITMFIDGIDLMAKEDKKELGLLVDTAKVLASEGDIRIVFVSSDYHALSIIMQHSKHRCQVLEVLDISDHDAINYLSCRSNKILSARVNEELVKFVGGRFTFLNIIPFFYNNLIMKKILSDEEALISELKLQLEAFAIGNSLDTISPNERKVLRHMLKESSHSLSIKQITNNCASDTESELMETATSNLLMRNVLKYDAKKFISFHNRCIKYAVKKRLPDNGWISKVTKLFF